MMIRACEEWSVEQRDWEDLPSMHEARSHFNPCLYYNLLYLCGSYSGKIETFDLDIREFQVLPCILPESNREYLTFIDENELVVLSTRYVTRWNRNLEQTSQKKRKAHRCISVVAPQVDLVNGLVYSVNHNGWLESLNIDGSEARIVAKQD